MVMPRKKQVMAPAHELEATLISRGYKCPGRKEYNKACGNDPRQLKNVPRFAYTDGSVRVLTENLDCPFWTIQKLANGSVLWFVDFPMDVTIITLLDFIDLLKGSGDERRRNQGEGLHGLGEYGGDFNGAGCTDLQESFEGDNEGFSPFIQGTIHR